MALDCWFRMAIITIPEIIDVIIMTLGIGYIFSGMFRQPATSDYDPLKQYDKKINTQNLKFAIMVTAPAVVFHELGHKAAALLYGLQATFHASYIWLGVGIVLKLLNFGFIFFVPGYVSIVGITTPLQGALTAFAGPGVNLLLWLFAHLAIKGKWFAQKYTPLLILTRRINLFLFVFNMLPFGIFDGAKVFSGLIAHFF